MVGGNTHSKSEEFWAPGNLAIVSHRRNMRNYITYNVPITLDKTHGQSPTLFSIYAFENSDPNERDGERDQHEYSIFQSGFLYTHYLHIF